MKKLLILNYHDILANDTSQMKHEFNLKYSQFMRHLDLIERTKLPVIRLSEWKETNRAEELFVALTFDDGYESHYHSVFPALQERNIQAAFFPIISSIEQEGFMNWADLQEIQGYQHEIGCHGYSHKKLAWLTENELRSEILEPRKLFHQNLNLPVTHFALPSGVYTKKTLRHIKNADFKTVLTTGSKINLETSSFVLHRFNVKNTMDTNDLLHLLTCDATTLKRRKNLSRSGLAYNRLSGLINLVHFKKSS